MPETTNNVLPDELMNSVLGKLYDVLTNGDENMPKSDDNYLAWITPGIPYAKEDLTFMTEGLGGAYRREEKEGSDEGGENATPVVTPEMQTASKRYLDAETFARLVDFIPDTSGIKGSITENVWNAEQTLSQTYLEILTFSQVAHYEISEKTQQKIDELRSKLQVKRMEKDLIDETIEREVIEDSPLTKKYFEKMQNYITAVLEYNSHRISALSGDDEAAHFWAINAAVLRSKVTAAYGDWVANGYKEKYEEITAFLSQVEGRSMELLKARYLDEFRKATLTSIDSGTDFIYSRLIPASFIHSDNGWATFSFSKSDYERDYEFDLKKGHANAGLDLGFFKIDKLKGKYKDQLTTQTISMDKFKLSFKIAQVPIWRAGINYQFLTSKYWRFDQTNLEYKNQMVCDGNRPPSGMLPAYTTACIFIKDLKLVFSNADSEYLEHIKNASGSGGVSFGPFSLGGGYKHNHTDREFESHREGQSITIPGIQLIGFKCHILPKSPDPNPEVKDWGA